MYGGKKHAGRPMAFGGAKKKSKKSKASKKSKKSKKTVKRGGARKSRVSRR
jgi:hypothetical protein